MSAPQIRRQFLEFFRARGHEVVKSSPLLPHNDPTLLFTNAGMNQFKDVFTGRESRPYRRAASSQKCVRAGGKHNDLENVGRTARHHTFFEMLGNFSFGDYFKEEAIVYAWELLTRDLGIDPKRLVVTVFGGDAGAGLGPDDEARTLWRKVSGFSEDRIIGLGMKDNFWMMGDTGPQGPCSEIHYFIGDGAVDLKLFNQEPGPDGTGWMEIWNLVFMQFERAAKDAPLTRLPKPSIDTGAGLERIACVIQGARSNYDTDLLRPLVEYAGELGHKKYHQTDGDDDVSMRVLADHARATTFLMTDGVMPSNEGRGYVLRRIMRRAIRHGVRLGLNEGHFRALCERVIAMMGEVYPELVEAKSLIVRAVDAEDQTFRRTLDRGLKLLDEEVATLKKSGGKVIPGATVFKLYDTFGFPADLTRTIAEEHQLVVDEVAFEEEMGKQRARSENFGGSGEKAVADVYKALREELGATRFLGYELETTVRGRGRIRVLLDDGGRRVNERGAGQAVELVADQTPFYGEAGGQIGDTGRIYVEGEGGFEIEVTDTLKPGGDLIVHRGKVVRGTVRSGVEAEFQVDLGRRDAIRANHSATHLLHWALRHVLGGHVTQKGSLVAPDRLRFDFSHFQPMTEEEKRQVEDLVNDEIRRNRDSVITEASFDEARALGAMALFGEKYGDRVRVLRIGEHSVELCGGTHVRRAGDIGLFKIVAETGIAQGVRRIEALTGAGALEYVRRMEEELGRAGGTLRGSPFEVAVRVERLQKELREREREIEDLKRKLVMGGGGGRDLLSSAREVKGVKLLAARTDVGDPKALREVADQLKDKIRSGIVVLGGVADGKVALVATVTADLVGRYHAGKIIGAVAGAVGGKGGGKPEMAQGGGTQPEALDKALEQVAELL
ncbi:MAG TPA: alanine--tRNA ligase [Polyangia bacterium]|nr:alanine--tRNA ligase [Polyangia bacterium]